MTAAANTVDRLRAAARAAAPDDDDLWAGGIPAEPGTAPTGGGSGPGRRRRGDTPALPPYIPTPVPLLGGSRYPVILVEGGAYSGKTHMAFELGGTDLVGATYALALGEDVDEYEALAPGAMRLPHDGTWYQISGCVDWVAQQAHAARNTGQPPPLLIIDSGTLLWELLTEWVETRARNTDSGREKLARDPDAVVQADPLAWTPAHTRHRRLMAALVAMPAVVVITARSRWIHGVDPKTGTLTREKEYRVEGHRELPYGTTAWIRLADGCPPVVWGLRRAKGGIRPGRGDHVTIDQRRFPGVEFSLEWLLRRVLRWDHTTARLSTAVQPSPAPDPVAPPPVDATEPAGAGPATGDITPATSADIPGSEDKG